MLGAAVCASGHQSVSVRDAALGAGSLSGGRGPAPDATRARRPPDARGNDAGGAAAPSDTGDARGACCSLRVVVTDRRRDRPELVGGYAGSGSPWAGFGRVDEGCAAAVDTSVLSPLGRSARSCRGRRL